jgi:hypothetical protein
MTCFRNEQKKMYLQLCLHFNTLDLLWEYWLQLYFVFVLLFVVTVLISIAVLTQNRQFFSFATIAFSELYETFSCIQLCCIDRNCLLLLRSIIANKAPLIQAWHTSKHSSHHTLMSEDKERKHQRFQHSLMSWSVTTHLAVGSYRQTLYTETVLTALYRQAKC